MIGRVHWLVGEDGVWYKRIDFDGRVSVVDIGDVPSVVRGLVRDVAPKGVVGEPAVINVVEPVSEVVAKVVPVKEAISTDRKVGIRAMQKRRKKIGNSNPVGRPRLKEYDMGVICREVDGGRSILGVCLEYGISRSVYYAYRRKGRKVNP